jgi:uncharacterized membrane protein
MRLPFLLLNSKNLEACSHRNSLTITSFVVPFVPIIGGLFGVIVQLPTVVLWLFLMFKAFQCKRYKLPMAGATLKPS